VHVFRRCRRVCIIFAYSVIFKSKILQQCILLHHVFCIPAHAVHVHVTIPYMAFLVLEVVSFNKSCLQYILLSYQQHRSSVPKEINVQCLHQVRNNSGQISCGEIQRYRAVVSTGHGFASCGEETRAGPCMFHLILIMDIVSSISGHRDRGCSPY
jgi:hypothetical protein